MLTWFRLQKVPLVLILLLPVSFASAQVNLSDSSFSAKAVSQATAIYQDMIGQQSRLNNGVQYIGYPFAFVKGHPFFDFDSLQNGTILYDHILYNNVQLMYDELSDLVLVSQSGYRIQLSNERISRFTIGSSRFVRLVKDSTRNTSVDKDGFYQVLYQGRVGVYKRELKTIQEELSSSEGTLRSILARKNFFIRKGDDYFPANSKKAILGIFADRKKEIRDYMKSGGLSFKNDPETMLVKSATYYEQLPN